MTNVVLANKCLSTMPGADEALHFWTLRFENDVKTYGTQTNISCCISCCMFENDVKTYGTQTMHLNHTIGALVWEWCKNVWYSNYWNHSSTSLSVWEWCKNVWYSNGYILQPVFREVWEWCKNVWYSNKKGVILWQKQVWEWCKNVWYSNSAKS